MLGRIIHGDALEELKKLTSGSVDLIVTDPPYGYSFMGKDWDKGVPEVGIWKECLRVLKPGAFAFIMSAPRQDVQCQMITNLHEAGFVLAFTPLYWTYASGFPKAMNISKAVDKRNERNYNPVFKDYMNEKRKEKNLSFNQINELLGKATSGGGTASALMGDKTFNELPTLEIYTKLKEILEMDGSFDELIEREEAEREVIGTKTKARAEGSASALPTLGAKTEYIEIDETIPATPQAKALDGSYAGFQPKPATELILRAQKPLDLKAQLTIITSQALCMIDEVEKCISVNSVKSNLAQVPIVKEYIAQRPVVEKICEEAEVHYGRVASGYVQMDILKLILGGLTEKKDTGESLNTVWLWKSILVDLLGQVNIFTTKTAIEQIIELRILNSLIGRSIQESVILVNETEASGLGLNVEVVESILKSVVIRLQSLKQVSAHSSVSQDMEKPSSNALLVVENLKSEVNTSLEKENTAQIGVTTVIVAMKPLSEKTYVEQAMKNGKGVTWLDDCRVPYKQGDAPSDNRWGGNAPRKSGEPIVSPFKGQDGYIDNPQGRFPANLLVSDDVLNDGKVTKSQGGTGIIEKETILGQTSNRPQKPFNYQDSGSFSRYFSLDAWAAKLPKEVQKTYPFLIVPKASSGEKNEDVNTEPRYMDEARKIGSAGGTNPRNRGAEKPRKNFHPTVKPLQLKQYLVTLGSRQGDTILDLFLGSGTTGLACEMLARNWVGIEISEEYCEIAKARLNKWKGQARL